MCLAAEGWSVTRETCKRKEDQTGGGCSLSPVPARAASGVAGSGLAALGRSRGLAGAELEGRGPAAAGEELLEKIV